MTDARLAIDVLAVLASGSLGTLALGMSRGAIVALLGSPDSVSQARRAPEIMRYGRLQLQIDQDRLVLATIACGAEDVGAHPAVAYVGALVPSSVMVTVDEFEREVARSGLSVEPDRATTYGENVTLRVTVSGARAAFVAGRLDRVYVFAAFNDSGR